MGLAIGLLIKGLKIRKSIPKFIEVFTCDKCHTLASVSVVNEKIKITKCRCVQCLTPLLKSNQEKENKMSKNEMKIRYNELMRIAKGDEFMSMTEFEELLALTKKLAKQPLPGIPRKKSAQPVDNFVDKFFIYFPAYRRVAGLNVGGYPYNRGIERKGNKKCGIT